MIDVTVKVGRALDHFGNRLTNEWMNDVKIQHGLRVKIKNAVFDFLGFRCNYSVESIRYGSDGTVWVKVKAEADERLDYWECHE